MRLLIVEDEPEIILALYRSMTSTYKVDSTGSVAGALKKLNSNVYDGIILDLNLPDGSGLTICEQIRQEGVTTPILVLSALTDVVDKVKLLDSGANDYLTKPFSMEELKARLRVLLRSPKNHSTERQRLVVGDLTMDTLKREVKRGGKPIKLRRKEFAVLECLMKNAGRVVTRSSINDYAWDDQAYSATNTVDVHIKYLRDRIDRPFKVPLIKTVHGVGYKIDTAKFSRA